MPCTVPEYYHFVVSKTAVNKFTYTKTFDVVEKLSGYTQFGVVHIQHKKLAYMVNENKINLSLRLKLCA